jgi:23S rRNA (uridine2552-2'-O)-methyltransferase
VNDKTSGKPSAGKRIAGKQQGGAANADSRPLKVRLKKARSLSNSSQKWLQRQLNDPYVARAKRDGWRSRAAFKLIEIDDKLKLLRPGLRVVDLGAAPGGWSQVAAKRVKSEDGHGKVIAIDLLEVEPIAGVSFEQLDFLTDEAPARLIEMLGGGADVVLSDMAANTTGHRATDHLRIVGLVELAIDFARRVLAPGGAFVAKVFQGGTEGDLLADMKRDFTTVKHVKPQASRADSAELYVVATGFRGRSE